MKISVLFLMFVIISGISLIGINQAFADFCVSNVAGTWNNPSTWGGCSGGVPDNTGDSADIQTNGDVQLNNDFVIGSLTVQEGGSLSINRQLTADDLLVTGRSDLFINCFGELIITTNEGGDNRGLLTNHGLLQTLLNVPFFNSGTYQSSGTDIFGGTFTGNDIEPITSICVIGGEFLPIDTTALLLAGVQTNAAWMIPVIVSAVGFGIVILRKL